MLHEVEALIKPIPVENSTRLEEYIKQAQSLKLQGKSLYSKQLYLEAAASFTSYIRLVPSIRNHNSASQPMYRRQIFGLSNEIPLIQNLNTSCATHLANLNPSELLRSSMLLKPLKIPSMLIDQFIAISYPNTEREIETLAILAGFTCSDHYEVCGLVLPKQSGCGDSCECLDDESLFKVLEDEGWQIMGWIHTHPNHDLFLSSIDLHTQASYQWLFPESIAIVFAPTHPKQLAAFRITTSGLEKIRKCKQNGFHPHERALYKEASNVEYIQSTEFRVVDLR